jgi:hypothetical protein
MNSSSSNNDRPIDWNNQSPRTNKATTSITTLLVDEDNKAHSSDAAAHRAGPQDNTLQFYYASTPPTSTRRPPACFPSRKNTMGDDGFNKMFEERHASLEDDDDEELPMSLYLPNLYYSNHSNGRRQPLRVSGDNFIRKPFTYYEL